MAETAATTPRAKASGLGDRLRSLRLVAGLTQTELAGDRFSKEYVSQIERGKTRPTPETIDWLARQLGVDPAFLAQGVSTDERGRIEATLARAEALSEAHRYDEAIESFREARATIGATGSVELEQRGLAGEAWALMQYGDVREATDLLQVARELVSDWSFTDGVEEILIETRTGYGLPHSVTIWCVAIDGQLYVGASAPDFPKERRWVRNVRRDPDVRLAIAGQIYERRLELISDPALTDTVDRAFGRKYQYDVDEDPDPVVYWRVVDRG